MSEAVTCGRCGLQVKVSEIGAHIDAHVEISLSLRAPEPPDWVAKFLNRRTDVEVALRAPLIAQRKGLPVPEPLTPEQMDELANKLAVPEEFQP